ncbi:MAG: HU family DNA-binding protein [Oscillatoriales cyanobacterium SM2_2_1]|nr:HU family DNA-binding protein [Oscillatoriales cyanobacterium SM2_2_1]
MNKGELVNAITERAAQKGITIHKKTAEEVLTVMLDVVIDSVAEGKKVTLVGFGSFEPRVRKAREGRNPKTGEKMDIPETTVPAFSAGKSFKERVNPGAGDLDDED